MYGERFVRIWRVYLSGSQAAFECGQLQLFQVVFARQDSNDVPWTRGYLYENDATGRRTHADNPISMSS